MRSDDVVWQRWEEVDRVFARTLDEPEETRAGFLRSICGDDRALFDAVQDLLDATATDGTRGSTPGPELVRAAWSGTEVDGGSPAPGDVIERYRIVGELGSGGMATVYEAERSDGAYDQKVALKVMRRGLDTDRIVERFLAERQILSGLAHPHIARLLDGGATADGRPYLVMERVEGRPITAWADEHDLPERARLGLFLQAADAVREAHRRLVVHRDLKPSNILVDASGCVKLLDFGIAKLLDPGAASDLTQVGPYPLTRAYASPEQRRGEVVTTSSDVYQLGLILRELLGGSGAPGAGPPPPAAKLGRDITTMIAHALEPDPQDRYPSVEALAEDVRRYLEGRPIQARPAPWWLRARKWVGRNRWAPPVAAVLVLGIGAYLATLVVTGERLERERNEAQRQAARAERSRDFLVDLFQSADPFGGGSEARADITVAAALARAADRIRGELDDDPMLQADLLHAVARVLHRIDRTSEALPLIEEAIRLRRQGGEGARIELAADLSAFAGFMMYADYDSATSLHRRAVALLRASVDSDDPRLADALAAWLGAQVQAGPQADAWIGEEALRIYRERDDGSVAGIADVQGYLAVAYTARGDLDAAETAARAAHRAARREGGPESAAAAQAAVQLAGVLDRRQRFEEAVPLYHEAIRIFEVLAGPEHSQTLFAQNNLATTYLEMGRAEDAVRIFRDVQPAVMRVWGPQHAEAAAHLQNLATALKEAGRYAEADSLAGAAYEMYLVTTPEGHPLRAYPLLTRTEILLRVESYEAAERVATRAIDLLEVTLPSSHYAVAVARCRLGAARLGRGRTADARVAVSAALTVLRGDERTPERYRAECEAVAERIDGSSLPG